MTMRSAKLDDARQLLEWRNSSSAREFSQNSELIQIEEHMAWLSKRLERIILEPFHVFELNHKLVGMSRLDFESAGHFEISILVAPDHQGRGAGARILNMTCENFFELHSSHTILAKVHQFNFVSQKLFVNAGFVLQNSANEFYCYKKQFKLVK